MTRRTPRSSPLWGAVAFVLAASLGGCVLPPPPGYYASPAVAGPYPAYGPPPIYVAPPVYAPPPVAGGPYLGGGWGYRPWR